MILRINRGFTLIELLIVIAIIGVLSSVVLGSISTARGKSGDSKVKAQLAGLRDAAEIYYDSNGHYGTEVSDDCVTSEFFSDADTGLVNSSSEANYPTGSSLSCHTDGTNYAVSALLLGVGGGQAWCVDSTGSAHLIPANLVAGEVECP